MSDLARAPKQRNPWPFMAAIALLCVAGWFIVKWMSDTSSVQDCFASGRKKCGDQPDPSLGR